VPAVLSRPVSVHNATSIRYIAVFPLTLAPRSAY